MPRVLTARSRFTVLYGGLFLGSGAVLVAVLALVTVGASRSTQVAPDQVPDTTTQLAQAHARIAQLQAQLDQQSVKPGQLLVGSLIALALMTLMSIFLGRFAAGRVLRPLRSMTAATRRISADNLHQRLAVPGPSDEVKDLADTIDELLGRLEGAFAAQRRFVANASHELRTPLATMRASLDVAAAKPEPAPPQTLALAGRLRAELDQVDRLLDGFLILARTQHGALPGREPVALDRVVADALAARAPDIAGLTLEEDLAGAAVDGNPTLLRRMVDNVIDNAIRHGGGWIRVATGDGVLTVETSGEMLDRAQVAELAQPFRRLGRDRTGSGSGLGLSIVASIAAAHHGTLHLRARPEGGLAVTVALPVSAGIPV
jgi:signal transduction histidine kinase